VLLAILASTSSFGFEGRLPAIDVGIHLELPDALLVGSLAYIALQWLSAPGFSFVRTPLDRPLLAFVGVTLFSTLMALLQSSVNRDQAIEATRIFSFYLSFFIVTNLVRERRQLDFLLSGIVTLASVVAVAMVLQYAMGVQLLQGTQDVGDISTTRIAPPGFSIVIVSFVVLFCKLVCERFRPAGLFRFLQCGLLGLAVVLTFFRSYWAALILVLSLVVYLGRGTERQRLVGWATVVMFPIVLILVLTFTVPDLAISKLVRASWDRFSTVGSTQTFTGGDASYDYRRIENQYAFAAIAKRPLIGYGLGASFRPLDLRLDWRDEQGLHDLTNHLHNAHLGILVQSGVLGYGCLMWLSVSFLLRGLRNWRKVPGERLRAVVLGLTLVWLALLISGGANSHFALKYWTPVIGIVLGINEAILRKLRPS